MGIVLAGLHQDFIDSSGPLFLGWIAFSILVGVLYHKNRNPGSSLKAALQFVAPARVYFSKSAFQDVFIYFNNLYLIVGVAWLTGMTQFSTAKDYTESFLMNHFGFSATPLTANLTVNLLYSFGNIVAFDIAWFLSHWAFHKIPVLWAFHKVHHSATQLTPLTRSRFHIFENIPLYTCLGVAVALNTYMFKSLGYSPSLVTVMNGFPLLMIFFSMFGVLRHTEIPISFGKLDWIISSPAMHQIHHSCAPEHIDKNYAMNFSILDWMIGSLVLPEKDAPQLKFGISEKHEDVNVLRLYFTQPFVDAWNYVRRGEILKHAANADHSPAAPPIQIADLKARNDKQSGQHRERQSANDRNTERLENAPALAEA